MSPEISEILSKTNLTVRYSMRPEISEILDRTGLIVRHTNIPSSSPSDGDYFWRVTVDDLTFLQSQDFAYLDEEEKKSLTKRPKGGRTRTWKR